LKGLETVMTKTHDKKPLDQIETEESGMAAKKKSKLKDMIPSKPKQLDLFQQSTGLGDGKSQILNLFDNLPKFVSGKRSTPGPDGRLSVEVRYCEVFDTKLKVTIIPARINKEDDEYVDRLPGEREEILLAILIKLATQKERGVYLDNQASVFFSIRDLQTELKRFNRTLSHNEIKEGLETLAGASYKIHREDGPEIFEHYIDSLGFNSNGARGECYVRFNGLVTRSINFGFYRLYEYDRSLSFRSTLARRLYKRLATFYTGASYFEKDNTYRISFDRLFSECGMERGNRPAKELAIVNEALQELVENEVAESFLVSGKKSERMLTIKPTREFASQIKQANAVQKGIQESLEQNQPGSKKEKLKTLLDS
jgi:hypothetical protein